jgi:nitrite reductase (NO-forming)
MRPRDTMRLYQTAARVWLTAAAASLLLPRAVRLEWWVPIHLVLLGAVSVAISGAMQNFVSALTATPPAHRLVVVAQFALTNGGAASIVAGRSSGERWLVAAGGAAFLLGIALLGGIVARAWRRALHLRHRVPVAMYEAAVTCVLAGAAIGTLLATGAARSAEGWSALRSSHLALNVLGWVSLTIVGTLITLLPTVLRVRMPPWRGFGTAALFVLGVSAISAGLALRATAVATAGAACFAAAVIGLLVMVGRVAATPRKWPIPVSAKHLLLAVVWLAAGAVWLLAALSRGGQWFAGAGDVFVVVFAGGWILQTLLGAWQYLLPMTTPAHPEDRRRMLAAMEWGGTGQLVSLNAGLALLAIAASGPGLTLAATAGAVLALAGAGMALLKAWTYPLLGGIDVFTRRSRRVWDPTESGRLRDS